MPKHVFFDLDNTLVDRAGSVARYVDELLPAFPDVQRRLGKEHALRIILECDNGGYLPPDAAHATIGELISERLVHALGASTCVQRSELEAHWRQLFPECSIAMPGANGLCEALSRRGITMSVVSNGSQRSREATLNALPFSHAMLGVLSSAAVGEKKPSPLIFERALADAELDPEECCFIGDHPINDIDGARRAGMQTIWLEGFHSWPENVDPPRHSVVRLEDAAELLGAAGNEKGSDPLC